MKTMEKHNVDSIIKESLNRGMSYETYLNLVSDLVKHDTTTGNEKTEALANYTKLNERRMKRWEKTIKLNDEIKKRIKDYSKKITWLVISESWCGDAAHILPVVHKVAQENANISLKIVLRDENPELMNAFLTNGARSIPKLIMIDEAIQAVINTFGPRPTTATKMVMDYKRQHGKLTPEFKEDLQHWYNKDKGLTTAADLLELLS